MNSNRSGLDPRVPQIVYDIFAELFAGIQLGTQSITFSGPNQILGSDANGNTITSKLKDNQIDTETISISKIIGLTQILGTTATPTTYNVTYVDDNGNTVQKVINDLNTAYNTISTLYGLYNNLKSTYTSFKALYDAYTGTNNTRYMLLQEEADATEVQVSELQTEVSSVQTQTQALQTRTTAIETVNSAQDVKIASNTANIATNTTNIATNTASIATNTTQIATNTASIATNTTQIATNTASIATNTTAIATNTSAIAAITTVDAAQSTAIAGNTSSIAALYVALIALGLFSKDSNGNPQPAANPPDYSGDISTLKTNVMNLQTDDNQSKTFLAAMVASGYATLSNGTYTIGGLQQNFASLNSNVNIATQRNVNTLTFLNAMVSSNYVTQTNVNQTTGAITYVLSNTFMNAISQAQNTLTFLNAIVANGYATTSSSGGLITYTLSSDFANVVANQANTRSLLFTTLDNFATRGFYVKTTNTSVTPNVTTYTPTNDFGNIVQNVLSIGDTLTTAGLMTSTNTAGKVYTSAGSNSTLATASPLAPTIQKFLSGSGTYTTPTNPSPLYIRVKMCAGGGGGGGSVQYNSGTPGNGTSGGNTTFGSNLTCGAGIGGGGASTSSVAGGTNTITNVTGQIIILNIAGGPGGQGNICVVGNANSAWGGQGGSTPLGASAPLVGYPNSGITSLANTGNGGSGASQTQNTSGQGGSGGSAGGYIEAIIASPASSYSYSVGVGGTGGTAGSGGAAGGNGSSGIIIVEEYYPQLTSAQTQITNTLTTLTNGQTSLNNTNKSLAAALNTTGLLIPTLDANGFPTTYTVPNNSKNLVNNLYYGSGLSLNGNDYLPPYQQQIYAYWQARNLPTLQCNGAVYPDPNTGGKPIQHASYIANWYQTKGSSGAFISAGSGTSVPRVGLTDGTLSGSSTASPQAAEVYCGEAGFLCNVLNLNNYTLGVSGCYTMWIIFRSFFDSVNLGNTSYYIMGTDSGSNGVGLAINQYGLFAGNGFGQLYAVKSSSTVSGQNSCVTLSSQKYYYVSVTYSVNDVNSTNYYGYSPGSAGAGSVNASVAGTQPNNAGFKVSITVNGKQCGQSAAGPPSNNSSSFGLGCRANTNNSYTTNPSPIGVVACGIHQMPLDSGAALTNMFQWVQNQHPAITFTSPY